MSKEGLKEKALKGFAWGAADKVVNLVVTFVFSIILARLLGPEAYGTIAMLTVFISISNVFVNSGFQAALVRKNDRTEEDCSTMFYFNIVVSVICYIVLFAISPYVARFYHEPVLSPLLKLVGLGVILGAFTMVQQAQLTIRIDFKTKAAISVVANIISGGVGILLAFRGWGVWSLAVMNLVTIVVSNIMLWTKVRWHPTTGFSWKSFHELFDFGSKMMASSIIDTLYNNLHTIVIGKVFKSASLGFYSKAKIIAGLPSTNITGVLQNVSFPVLAKMQDDDDRLALNYRRLLRVSAFFVFPLMVVLAGVAKPLVTLMLGAKWMGCVTLLQVVCFARMWLPIHAINLNLLQVKGRSDLFLRLEIIKKLLGVTVLVITLPQGLVAICYGEVFSSIVALAINTYYTGKLIGAGFFVQMRDLAPTVAASAVAFIATCFVVALPHSYWVSLIAGGTVGLAVFAALAFVGRFQAMQDAKSVLPKGRKAK